MKHLKQTHHKKAFVATIVIAIVILVGYGSFALATKSWPFTQPRAVDSDTRKEIDNNPPTDSQKAEGDRIKEEAIKNPSTPPTTSPDNKVPVDVIITSANQSGNSLQIRTLIQTVDKGTCILRLVQSNSIVSKTSATQSFSNSTACQGFTIPVSELGLGEWEITLIFSGTSSTGSTSDKVTITR